MGLPEEQEDVSVDKKKYIFFSLKLACKASAKCAYFIILLCIVHFRIAWLGCKSPNEHLVIACSHS